MNGSAGSFFTSTLKAASFPAQRAQSSTSGSGKFLIRFRSAGVNTRLMYRESWLFPLLPGSVKSTMSFPIFKIPLLHPGQLPDDLPGIVPLGLEPVVSESLRFEYLDGHRERVPRFRDGAPRCLAVAPEINAQDLHPVKIFHEAAHPVGEVLH